MAKVVKISGKKTKQKRAKFLYLFLIPIFISTIISLFHSDYSRFAIKIVSFILFFIGIKLVDRGLEEEESYKKAKIYKVSLIKYKLLGYIVISSTLLFMAINLTNQSMLNSIIQSIIGFVGLILYYGIDPFKDKLPKGNLSINMDRFLKELQEAQAKVDYIKGATEHIQNWQLKVALNSAIKRAQEILNTIKEDPKDIRVARKFMVVYLDGIKDVIDKYNSIDKEHLDSEYTERLIDTLNFATQKFEDELDRLKSNDIFDLDVQIDALKEQLKH